MPVLIPAAAWRGLAAIAIAAALATPALAMNERDTDAVNQKMNKAGFIAGFAQSGLQNLQARPEAIACRDIRAAQSDMAAAAKLSREALALIGSDMLGEYKTQRDKLNAIVKLEADSDATLAACKADGL